MNGIWSEGNVEGKKAWQLAENDECGNNDAKKNKTGKVQM